MGPTQGDLVAEMDALQVLVLALGPAGAAWAGVKVSLNGTVNRVRRVEEKLDEMSRDMASVKVDVGRIEGTMERRGEGR